MSLGFRKSPLLPQPIFSPHANMSSSNNTMVMPQTTVPALSRAPACMPCYPQIPPFGWFLDKHLKCLPFPYSPTYFRFSLHQPRKWHLQFPTETWMSILPPTSNQVLSTVPLKELSNSPAPCCLFSLFSSLNSYSNVFLIGSPSSSLSSPKTFLHAEPGA